mmetsp:Transcript_22998/g.36730  ORF Transcript_22998/g.36730 Transcript_22998/m.36730 type:complete len:111 (-) Transcript_22998:130-462(-)
MAAGIQLWKIAIGFAMMVHAAYALLDEKRRTVSGMLGDDFLSPQVVLEVVLGAMLALWGGIGEFKPIRIHDSKKPRWESLHSRDNFQNFLNRGRQFSSVIEKNLLPPPKD